MEGHSEVVAGHDQGRYGLTQWAVDGNQSRLGLRARS